MAVIQSSTYTLNVELKDSHGGKQTFKINNPLQSGLTLQQVKEAFQDAFEENNTSGVNLLCGSNNYSYIGIEAAYTEFIVKTVTDLN